MNATLSVVGGQVQLQDCSLYVHKVAVLNNHHICPESWWQKAGKPVNTPMIMLCSNCHSNTHACIDGMILGRDISLLPPRCQKLAQQALSIAASNGLTPSLTL